MTLAIRRIVTGHNAQGRAIAQIDDMSPNYVSPRPGIEGVQIWTTVAFPALCRAATVRNRSIMW